MSDIEPNMKICNSCRYFCFVNLKIKKHCYCYCSYGSTMDFSKLEGKENEKAKAKLRKIHPECPYKLEHLVVK